MKAPEGFLAGRRGVVLTDRDGVLNKANAFISKLDDVTADVMIPAGLEGVRALNEAELATVQRELSEAGVEHEVRQLVRGLEPSEDLIAVAEEVGADFIVIGLRRRTPVGKLILGSNAQRILLDAPCPVLAVKADA